MTYIYPENNISRNEDEIIGGYMLINWIYSIPYMSSAFNSSITKIQKTKKIKLKFETGHGFLSFFLFFLCHFIILKE